MAQYETVYATIVIIGVLGFVIDVLFERLRARLVAGPSRCTRSRWDRHDAPAAASAKSHRCSADRARSSRSGTAIAVSGVAPPSLLPPPAAVFARLVQQLGDPRFLGHVAITLFRLFVGFGIAVVVGVTLGVAATGSRTFEGVDQAAGARAGAGAEDRALSGVRPDPRLRPCLQDCAGRRRRRVSDPARDLSGHDRGRAEAGLVGARRRHVAARRAVHRRADGGDALGAHRLPHRARSSRASSCSWPR